MVGQADVHVDVRSTFCFYPDYASYAVDIRQVVTKSPLLPFDGICTLVQALVFENLLMLVISTA